MAHTAYPTLNSGDSWTASQANTYWRDNDLQYWPYTTAGDMMYAATASTSSRLAAVAGGVLTSSASAPAWLAPGTEYQSLRMNSGATAAAWEHNHFASVYHNTTQNVSNASATALVFNSEYSDTPTWHSTVSNTSRMTVTKTGYYLVSTSFTYAAAGGSGSYWDTVELRVNGTIVLSDRRLHSVDAFEKRFTITFPVISVSATNYIEIYLEQNSGGTRAVQANATFSVLRVG